MQQAGQSLAKKTEALIKEYHRQGNIQQTIDALSQAFPGMINPNFVTDSGVLADSKLQIAHLIEFEAHLFQFPLCVKIIKIRRFNFKEYLNHKAKL